MSLSLRFAEKDVAWVAIISRVRFLLFNCILVVAAAICVFAQGGSTPASDASSAVPTGIAGRAAEEPAKPTLSRDAVIFRAMNYLHDRAQDNAFFMAHGGDLAWCFYSISRTSREPQLRSMARTMGRELAQRWRQSHAHVPPNASADKVYDLASSAYAVDRFLGVNRKFRAELRQAAAHFTAKDYMEFDAVAGPPPAGNPGRFKMWENALVIAFFGDAYGVRLGASYKEVVRWLPAMHPYATDDDDLEFDMFYGTTHLIYTLNAYNQRRVSPTLLPQEVAFIKHKLAKALEDDDPEMVGESLDTLKALGQENDPLVQQGSEYLLENQELDGTWVEEEQRDAYTAYHAAWTAIDGLRDYRYRGTVKRLPRTARATGGTTLQAR